MDLTVEELQKWRLLKDYNDNLKRTEIKNTLVNIDSSMRNIKPKNIVSNEIVLSKNPITFTANSEIIKIAYDQDNLVQGDRVIIKNVSGYKKVVTESAWLINNLQYMKLSRAPKAGSKEESSCGSSLLAKLRKIPSDLSKDFAIFFDLNNSVKGTIQEDFNDLQKEI
jgi:hypothetical protein